MATLPINQVVHYNNILMKKCSYKSVPNKKLSPLLLFCIPNKLTFGVPGAGLIFSFSPNPKTIYWIAMECECLTHYIKNGNR